MRVVESNDVPLRGYILVIQRFVLPVGLIRDVFLYTLDGIKINLKNYGIIGAT